MTQTVLITGASGGIGSALVRHYASAGDRVLAARRNAAAAEPLREAGDVEVFQLDVTAGEDLEQLARRLEGGSLDLLINNAGTMGEGFEQQALSGDMTDEAWLDAFSINAIGAFRVTQRCLDALRRGSDPKVANISSVVAGLGRPVIGGLYQYRTTKAALNALTVGLALDLADEGIVVAAIHPGLVRTRMGGPDAPLTPEDAASQLAATIEGLTSDRSGRFLNVDGAELPF